MLRYRVSRTRPTIRSRIRPPSSNVWSPGQGARAGQGGGAWGGLPAPRLLGPPPAGGLAPGAALGFVAHLFEAVGALPEEQVRRDGRAEDGDQEPQVGLVRSEEHTS